MPAAEIPSQKPDLIPNAQDIFENILEKAQPKRSENTEELQEKDITFQINELRKLDAKDVIKAAREEAVKFGVSAELILSWIYKQEIDTLAANIIRIANKKNTPQFWTLIRGNSMEAHEITRNIQSIFRLLGHESIPDDGTYGDKKLQSALPMAVESLQELLEVALGIKLRGSTDRKFGKYTLEGLLTLLKNHQEKEQKLAEDQRDEFETILARHKSAREKLQRIFGVAATWEQMGLNLSSLRAQYNGETIKIQNTDGITYREENYVPENILQPKGPEHYAPFGASNEIWEAEAKVLEETAQAFTLFEGIKKSWTPVQKMAEGISIYKNILSNKEILKNTAAKLLSGLLKEAYARIDSSLLWQERLKTGAAYWKQIPQEGVVGQAAQEALRTMAMDALQSPREIHWEEIQFYLPKEATLALSELSSYRQKISRDSKGITEKPLNSFGEEIEKLLKNINRQNFASDQLLEAFELYQRARIKPEAEQKAKEFLNSDRTAGLVKKAFRDIRASEVGSLSKLQAVKELYEAAPKNSSKTSVALYDLYTGKGNIDREMYGDRGLIGQAFAEIEGEQDTSIKLQKGREILAAIPETARGTLAYYRAYERFLQLSGAAESTDVQKPLGEFERTGLFRKVHDDLHDLRERILDRKPSPEKKQISKRAEESIPSTSKEERKKEKTSSSIEFIQEKPLRGGEPEKDVSIPVFSTPLEKAQVVTPEEMAQLELKKLRANSLDNIYDHVELTWEAKVPEWASANLKVKNFQSSKLVEIAISRGVNSYRTESNLIKLYDNGYINEEGGLYAIVEIRRNTDNALLFSQALDQRLSLNLLRQVKEAADNIIPAEGETVVKQIQTAPIAPTVAPAAPSSSASVSTRSSQTPAPRPLSPSANQNPSVAPTQSPPQTTSKPQPPRPQPAPPAPVAPRVTPPVQPPKPEPARGVLKTPEQIARDFKVSIEGKKGKYELRAVLMPEQKDRYFIVQAGKTGSLLAVEASKINKNMTLEKYVQDQKTDILKKLEPEQQKKSPQEIAKEVGVNPNYPKYGLVFLNGEFRIAPVDKPNEPIGPSLGGPETTLEQVKAKFHRLSKSDILVMRSKKVNNNMVNR